MTENTNINYFISLHQILYPNEKFNILEINVFKNHCKL